MTDRAFSTIRLSALAAVLALSACGWFGGNKKADPANDSDPEIASALNDQILVDGNLDNQSNRNGGRTPAGPANASYPASDAAAAAPGGSAQATAALGKDCANPARFDYNMGWAKRLSPDFPVYPGGQVTEAAANNSSGCSTRVVTFTTAESWQPILDWYHTRAVRSGYSSEHQVRDGDHVLAGAKGPEQAAFYLIVTPRPKGSEVALIASMPVAQPVVREFKGKTKNGG
ncbi:MAG TPA: hypothetical protein VF718_14275 [Allosphingosinicella sp.]|jgi:hypothetical protein